METLGERPIWSMSGGELLSDLDAIDAELARLQTRRLHLVARIDETGYAEELGARDAIELLAFRYRLDRAEAFRDIRLARALPKYGAVSEGLDRGIPTPPDDATAEEAGGVRLLRPVQAAVIVSALERVRSRVPVDDLDVAEEQLVTLASHLPPGELRSAAKQICDLLDSDGPEPEEQKAYARESLTLTTAENGVKFKGYLANENAELLRSVVHAGARPHKTIDGELDPRSREKRQADALTTALTIAATAADTGFTRTTAHDHQGRISRGRMTALAGGFTAGSADAVVRDADGVDPGGADPGGADPGGAEADRRDADRRESDARDTDRRESDARDANGREADARDANGPDADGVDAEAGGAEGGRARGGYGVGRGTPDAWVPGFGAKANITVTIDLEDLKRATADATGDLVYGDGLSASAIRRLACDAKIIPLVLGSNSEPLDVGRSERLVTRAMRRALNTRDKGCVVCGAPPIQCDAHHLVSWIDGGDTKVSNLVLLCRRHHVDLHNGNWTITITNGQVNVARPTWADPPPLRPLRPSPPATASGTTRHQTAASPGSTTLLNKTPTTEGRGPRPHVEHPWGDEAGEPKLTTPTGTRWANSATLQEAGRFAVWGDPSTTSPSEPDPQRRVAAFTHAGKPDPWGGCAVAGPPQPSPATAG